MSHTIEIVAFADKDYFSLFDGGSDKEAAPLDVDVRILVDAKLPAEQAAQVLEAAAKRLRESKPSDLANVRRLLRQIGAKP